jgi:hypothetical protein
MINITFTKEEINAVLTALSKFPYDQVVGIIKSVTEQAQAAQIEEAKLAETTKASELTVAE